MREEKVFFTNMCIVQNPFDGRYLFLKRAKHKAWPGYTFPGGHVEEGEDFREAILREMKEETGLDLHEVELRAVYRWPSEQSSANESATEKKKTNRQDDTACHEGSREQDDQATNASFNTSKKEVLQEVSLFYYSSSYSGTLASSEEGSLHWMSLEELKQKPQEERSVGLEKILSLYGLSMDEDLS